MCRQLTTAIHRDVDYSVVAVAGSVEHSTACVCCSVCVCVFVVVDIVDDAVDDDWSALASGLRLTTR